MDNKLKAWKAYDNFLKRRKNAYKDISPEEDPTEEVDPSEYYAAGTGFPPEDMENEVMAEMKAVAEENDGDIQLLFDESEDKSVQDKFFDAMHKRLSRRKKAADALTIDVARHAPKGGVTVKGKKFEGGWFIPSEGGYAEAYEKQLRGEEEEPSNESKEKPAPKEKETPKEEPKKEEPTPEEEAPDPEDEPKPKKEKVRTPEQQAKYDAMVKRKKEWRAKAVQITVGVPGEELDKELSGCKQRRENAKKFWKDNFDVDIDNGATGKEGYSPNDLVKKAMGNDAFKKLPMMDKISLVSEMQRKQLMFAYSDKVSVKQNRKQEAALVFGADTVRGCMNNCISCYACMLAGGMSTTKFDTPVAAKLSKKLILSKDDIQKDLDKWIAKREKYKNDPEAYREVKVSPEHKDGKIPLYKEADKNVQHYQKQINEMKDRGIDHTILRIGVVGDPATNWKHTNEQILKGLNGKSPDNIIFVSKLQRIDGFDPKVVRNMHISVDPFNSKHMETTMANVKKLKEQSPDLNIVLRIRSFDSKDPELSANLKKAVAFANENDLPVLETKMRYSRTIADLMKMNIDASYHATKGSNIKANHNFLGTKGYDTTKKGEFENPDNELKVNKHLECDPYLTGCQACGNCANTATQNYPWNTDTYIDVNAKRKERLSKTTSGS